MLVEQPIVDAVSMETMAAWQTTHLLTLHVTTETDAALLTWSKKDAVLTDGFQWKETDRGLC